MLDTGSVPCISSAGGRGLPDEEIRMNEFTISMHGDDIVPTKFSDEGERAIAEVHARVEVIDGEEWEAEDDLDEDFGYYDDLDRATEIL